MDWKKIILSALVMITGPAVPAQKITRDIPYALTPEKELKLDLYLPDGISNPYLVIWVHGGAWHSGSKENPPQDLVKLGYALASISYRRTSEAKFPAMIHDIKAAVRFLRSHADQYGYRGDKITLLGSSAGGHLVALAGLTNKHEGLEGKIGNDLATSSEIQAVIDFFGPADLTTILSQSTPHGLNVRTPALALMFGKPLEQATEELKMASPVYHVDAGDPPLFICHGDLDPQVPINQSIQLYGKYRELDLPVQLEFVHGGGHGGKPFSDPALIQKVDQFLKKHLGR
ncbi:MAG TPA: alpha/beta hydrolase [Saprospiraceae bacterium]|nr:alpha/beta hydrolase [Saprospiraceae bacterium]HNT19026.1 alpha/beta hydrolase [Saprospiraceae bacterium]